MSEWKILRLAAWRELVARRKAFLISTAIVVVIVGGVLVAFAVFGDTGDGTVRVGVVGSVDPRVEKAIDQRLGDLPLEIVAFDSRASGEEAMNEGDLQALITGPLSVVWGPSTTGRAADAVVESLRGIHAEDVGARLGLSEMELRSLLAPVQGSSLESSGEEDAAAIALSVVSAVLMFVAIIAYGQWIAYGVVEEKANRVAELILGALRPIQLLTAKLITIGFLGLAQLLAAGIVGIGLGTALDAIDLPPVTVQTVAWLVLWFVLGYAFYGAVYAAAGSLAADTQQAGSVIGPLNILPGIGYMTAVISFSAGSAGTLVRVLSFIPVWSPLVMPGLIARGWVVWWEPPLAIAIMVVSTYLVMRWAGRIYLGGITQATRTVGWREAFRFGKDVAGPERGGAPS